jgi:hypothetical protein
MMWRLVLRPGRELRICRSAGERVQERHDLVEPGEPDERIDDPGQGGILAAKQSGNQVELEQPTSPNSQRPQ